MNLLPPNRRRNFLPGGMPSIDWTNPLTAGLFACYVTGATGSRIVPNLTGMGLDLKAGSGTNFNNIQEGQAMVCTASTSGATVQGIPTNLKLISSGTLFWRGTFTGSAGGNNVPLIGIEYSNPEGSPFFVFGIHANTGGSSLILTGWNSSGTNQTASAAITNPGANKLTSLCSTIALGGNCYSYLNGVLNNTTAASSGTFQYSATSNVGFGSYLPITSRIANASGLIGMMWNRQLSPAEVLSISNDPYQFLIYPEDDIFDLMLRNLYSMIPDTGSYTVTGKNATLAAQRNIAPAQGTYALTGVAAILAAQRKIAPAAGSYTLTGVAALLAAQRRITPSAGSYVLSGQAAVLVAGRKIAPAAGSYILTGNAAALVAARKVYPSAGAYVLSGKNAQLTRGTKIIPSSGSYTLSGMSAILAVGHKISPDAGAYSLTGEAAILAAARKIYPDAGIYSLSGKDAVLRVGRELIPASGAYLIDGMDADLFVTLAALHPAPGVYGVTGFDVTFTVRRAKSKLILISGFLNDEEIEAVLRS